jgi:hypothetical protein
MSSGSYRNPSCLRLIDLGIFGFMAVWGVVEFVMTGDTTYLVAFLIGAGITAVLWVTIPRKQA